MENEQDFGERAFSVLKEKENGCGAWLWWHPTAKFEAFQMLQDAVSFF